MLQWGSQRIFYIFEMDLSYYSSDLGSVLSKAETLSNFNNKQSLRLEMELKVNLTETTGMYTSGWENCFPHYVQKDSGP